MVTDINDLKINLLSVKQ